MTTGTVRQYRFVTVDVFTSVIFGGNPLGVFPDAAGLDADRMQRIARELNLSETTFVHPAVSRAHACRLRIFTPAAELPFAGHPTVGSAVALAAIGAIAVAEGETAVVLEEEAGPVPVVIRSTAGRPWFARLTAPRLPETGPAPPPRHQLAALLGVDEGAIGGDGLEPVTCSAGVPFLFVPLRDEDTVTRVRFDVMRWKELLADSWAPNVYVFAPGDGTVRARMFAPGLGVPEDPATGAAAVALAGVLASPGASVGGVRRWTITQGLEMGRLSTLHLDVEFAGGTLSAVHLGGEAVLVSEGIMRVPMQA